MHKRAVWIAALAGTLLLWSGCPDNKSAAKKKKAEAPEQSEGSADAETPPTGETPPTAEAPGLLPDAAEAPPDKPAVPPTTADAETPPSPPEPPPKSKRKYKNCRDARPVTEGDLKTAEGTLYKVFEALLIEAEEESFQAFLPFIDTDFQRPADARRYWFKQARLINKEGRPFLRLVYSDKNPSYDVCSTRPEGKAGIRIFVGKTPPVGSNPPYVLHKVGDRWLLKNFSAF